jgi:hypothetical protein
MENKRNTSGSNLTEAAAAAAVLLVAPGSLRAAAAAAFGDMAPLELQCMWDEEHKQCTRSCEKDATNL